MRVLIYWLVLVIAVVTLGCNKLPEDHNRLWMKQNGRVKVLCTISMIGDVVERIGGEYVDVLTLISGDLNPHSYELVKGDDEKFRIADIIFCNGLGLEQGSSLSYLLKNNDNIVVLGDKVREQRPDDICVIDYQVDPHIWLDISLWKSVVDPIVDSLIDIDPEHKDYYRRCGEEVIGEFEKTHEEVRSLVQDVPDERRYLISTHDAFNYFVRAYLATDEEVANNTWLERMASPEGLSPESSLSVVDIQRVLNYALKHDVKVLFLESNVNAASFRKIVLAAQDKGFSLVISDDCLYGDAMGPEGSDEGDYLGIMRHNAEVIKKYLLQ